MDYFENKLLEIFCDLIKLDTSNPPGNEERVIRYLLNLFLENQIQCEVYACMSNRSNLLAKIPCELHPDKKPVILLSHIDVVPEGDGWTKPAFSAMREGKLVYGRGAIDTKHLTAMEAAVFLYLKKSGITLNRDVYFLATSDEEQGSHYGMKYLAGILPKELLNADVISEGGGFVLPVGGKYFRTCSCGEKGGCDIHLTIKKAKKTEQFEVLETLLERIANTNFDQPINEVNSAFFAKAGAYIEHDSTLANLWEYSSKDNLLVQAFDSSKWGDYANITLSYRFIPPRSEASVKDFIQQLLSDLDVVPEYTFNHSGYLSGLTSDIFVALEKASRHYDPETEILPILALGNTDGRFFKGNTYGYSPMLKDVPFSKVLKMVHQADECITIDSLKYGYDVIKDSICAILSTKENQ